MILKILAVRAIGIVESVKAAVLRRFTLIYGENGSGKTTLAAVLRSLATGDPRYITERRRLSGQADAHASVLCEGRSGPITFQRGAWNQNGPGIEVFDTRFISENVYVGPAVEHSQRRSLHAFVMGERGVQLARRVEDLTDEIADIEKDLNRREAEIQRHIGPAVEFKKYMALVADGEIDTKIRDQENVVEAVSRSAEITAHPLYACTGFQGIAPEEIHSFLASSVEDIAGDAEGRAKQHNAAHLRGRGESWLEEGTRFLPLGVCPFCGSPIEGNDLIRAYRAYFSEAYREHKAALDAAAADLLQRVSPVQAERLTARVASNTTYAQFWSALGVPGAAAALSADEVEQVLADAHIALSQEVERKRRAPLDVLEASRAAMDAIAAVSGLACRFAAYDASVASANVVARRKQEQANASNLDMEIRKLNGLRLQKDRHSDAGRQMCDPHNALTVLKKVKEKEKSAARRELDDFARDLFSRYERRLNEHLMKSGCRYTITGTAASYAGGKPSTEYRLMVDGQEVNLSAPKGGADGTAFFGNTLSEGDKSALAFGFFLTRLDLDPDLSSKTIVFDDPMTSQDVNRRTYTVKQIGRIAGRAKQVIVLTHDLYFARKLWDQADAADLATLTLARAREGSELEDWDIEAATRGEYYNNYLALHEFLEGAGTRDPHDVAGCIRLVLEENLRTRFPGELLAARNLGDMLARIRQADPASMLAGMQPLYDELDELNGYSLRYHHGARSAADSEPIVNAELTTYVKRTLALIAGVGIGVQPA